MNRLLDLTPQQMADRMVADAQLRAYLVYDKASQSVKVSHPWFQELADWLLTQSPDFLEHEAIFLAVAPESRCLFTAFVHKTNRGQALGGIRRGPYENLEEVLCDGLRLSLGMTRKSALAGLWWGGGKGIIPRTPGEEDRDPIRRRLLYREYGSFISSLRGCYLTAEDAGTHPADIEDVFHTTRFVTCVPPEMGGSGNPSTMTAAGVVRSIEAALDFLELGTLAGKKIAVQGTGHVGSAIIPLLLDRGAGAIVASDVSEESRIALLDIYAGQPVEIRLAARDDFDVLAEPCDVLIPSALGAVLGPKTIPNIRARLVCGPANNQLVEEERDGRALADRGITFVPDFVSNRMGVVNCGNEQYGHVNGDAMIQRHLSEDWADGIYQTTRRVLDLARSSKVTPVVAARRLADELATQLHPLWGHRGFEIIESLVSDHWES